MSKFKAIAGYTAGLLIMIALIVISLFTAFPFRIIGFALAFFAVAIVMIERFLTFILLIIAGVCEFILKVQWKYFAKPVREFAMRLAK